MDNCHNNLENISAYVDGELTEDEARRVEEHLAVCEACSAVLAFYHEMSVATDESVVDAPESLVRSVMEKINNEGSNTKKAGSSRPVTLRVIMTRYAPVAACLAVMLLAIPIVNSLRSSRTDNAAPEYGSNLAMIMPGNIVPSPNAPAPAPAYDSGADFNIPAEYDNEIQSAGEASIRAAGGSDADEVTGFTDDADRSKTGNNTPASALQPAPESAAPESAAPMDAPPPPAGTVPAEEPEYAFPPAAPPGLSTGESGSTTTSENTQDLEQELIEATHTQISDSIQRRINSAYACITFTGDMPEMLTEYKIEALESMDEQTDRDTFFEIPRSIMMRLLDELSGYDGVEVMLGDADSDYVIVRYVSGR